jgi:DnaA family protein
VAEQLVFELVAPGPPTFATFVAGRNAEAVAALERVAAAPGGETGVVLWGASGAGKSHLLAASVASASAHGRVAHYLADSAHADPALAVDGALVAVDDVDRADERAAGRLFTLFNALRERGGTLVAATAVPPARLTLRDDVRTRLGWGLVFEIVPLADAEKAAALAAYARERGFSLGDDVIGYLLAHGRRDMRALVATLAELDRLSLAQKRPVTVPLVRDWLQRRIEER